MNPVPAFSEDNEDEFNLDIVSGQYSREELGNLKYNHKYELTKDFALPFLPVFLLDNEN